MDELLDTAPCGFLTFLDDGTVIRINATLLDQLGYAEDEVLGRHVETLFTVAGRLFYQTHFFPLLKLHDSADEVYLSLQTKAGTALPVLANGARRHRSGRYENDCVFVRMGRRERFEDELLKARKAAEAARDVKAKFLSMMSHELRTPLVAISAFAKMLSRGRQGTVNDDQKQTLGRIERASKELLRLMNDILTFARQESGAIDLDLQPVPVATAFERAESLILFRLDERELAYAKEGFPPDLAVHADPDRLHQVLLNLLTNAVKFTPAGGRITVRCDHTHAGVRIQVADTGPGIPADQLDRIFEPFAQLQRPSRSDESQGAGLGLAISRDLIHSMDGSLTVASEVGAGSTFTIVLPAAAVPQEAGRA